MDTLYTHSGDKQIQTLYTNAREINKYRHFIQTLVRKTNIDNSNKHSWGKQI